MKTKFYTDCSSTKSVSLDDEFSSLYFMGVRRTKMLSAKEQRDLIYKSRHSKKEEADAAKTLLIAANQRFIASIAKHIGKKENFNDLVSEGNIGLLKAIENYNLTFSQNFISYAQFWIRKYMIQYMTNVEPSIKPKNAIKVKTYMDKGANEFFLLHGRMPSDVELQEFLAEKGIKFSKSDDLCPISISFIDEFDGNDDDAHNFGLLFEYNSETSTNNVEDIIDRDHIQNLVAGIFEILNDEEIRILKLLYGFNGEQENYERIAEITGKTEKEIKNIKNNAIKKIKTNFIKNGKIENYIQ